MRKKSEVGARSNRTFRLSEYEIKCLKEGARNAEMGESEYVRYLIVCGFLKNNADRILIPMGIYKLFIDRYIKRPLDR